MQSWSHFETQTLRRCGLHAINNLLQQEKFTRAEFENIATTLSKQTNESHCTYFIGNYDLNIIELALKREGYTIRWISQKETITEELLLNEKVLGLLLNVIKPKSFIEKMLQWDPRHWISVRKIPDKEHPTFLYLDSQKDTPQMKETQDLVMYLRDLQKNQENYLILVEEKEQQQ